MERQGIHELSAAYALDALDREDERAFEEHLAHCGECRERVASFHEAAAALAFDADAQAPPATLRHRILERARDEGANVVPLRRPWAFRAAAGIAAAAACVAVALGIWAASLESALDDERAARGGPAEVVALEGANGSLILTPSGEAVLVVSGLDAPPAGRTYEAWVIEDETPKPAGTFGGGERVAFTLTRAVPAGAVVAVTLERAGGVGTPTGEPLFTARAA